MSRSQQDRSRVINRRRFIAISATLGGAAMLPRLAADREPRSYSWRGVALGAEASLTLQLHDEALAKAAIAASLSEVARLEATRVHRASVRADSAR